MSNSSYINNDYNTIISDGDIATMDNNISDYTINNDTVSDDSISNKSSDNVFNSNDNGNRTTNK